MKEEEEQRLNNEARNFKLGTLAYERGQYPESVELLEQALKDVGEYSVTGGEVQLWLALAYQVGGWEEGAVVHGAGLGRWMLVQAVCPGVTLSW